MDSLSFSNTISKQTVLENTSMTYASLEDAKKRENDTISNERIQNGDRILETYEVTSDPISGGMGSVWRVHHQSWNTDLAMKRPQPRFFAEGSEKRKEQFIAECENWINLGLHPNIVSCYYVREIGGVPTIFSEWMDGGSLKDRIADGSLYEGTEEEVQERILDIAIQAARGLQYSHNNGLIHQDMKPGNLLLSKDWDAKVADFGLAKAKEQLEDKSETAKTTGYTLAYCPAEQANGDEPARWMDVYAWALTVLEMYAGKRLWETGAEAKERFDEYPANCIHLISDNMQTLLIYCLNEKPDYFREITDRLERMYRTETGSAYPRPISDAAVDTVDSLNNRALSFLELGKLSEAEHLWELALEKNPANMRARYNHFLYLWRSARVTDEEIENKLTSIVNSMPDQFDAAMMMLMFECERGDRQGVEKWLAFAKSYDMVLGEKLLEAANLILREDHFVPCSDSEGQILTPASKNSIYHIESSDYGGTVDRVFITEKSTSRRRHTFVVPGYMEKAGKYSMSGVGIIGVFSGVEYYQDNTVILKDRDLSHYATILTAYAKWHFCLPDYQAPFQLSKIESFSQRIRNREEFMRLLSQAQDYYSNHLYGECLKAVEQATAIPGYDNNHELLDLEYQCGNHCSKTGIRMIRAVDYPQSAVPDEKFEYQRYKVLEEDECVVSNPQRTKTATIVHRSLLKDEGYCGDLYCLNYNQRGYWKTTIPEGCFSVCGYEEEIFDIAFSPCGNYLLVSACGLSELRNVSDGKLIWHVEYKDYHEKKASFADDGRYMLIGGQAWEIRYYYEDETNG